MREMGSIEIPFIIIIFVYMCASVEIYIYLEVCVYVCVITVIVKRPAFPPFVVDELYRNIPSVIINICVCVQVFIYMYASWCGCDNNMRMVNCSGGARRH